MKHWIVMKVEDPRMMADVASRAEKTISSLNGSVESAIALFNDVTMVVEFPHRKYRMIEKSVESAVQVPVAVYGNDPYKLKKPI